MKNFLDDVEDKEGVKDVLTFTVATVVFAACFVSPIPNSTRPTREVAKLCIEKAEMFVDEFLKRKKGKKHE